MQTDAASNTTDIAAAAAALIQKTRWQHKTNGHWAFNTPAFLGTLTPIGVTRNGQSRVRAQIAMRRSPSYAIASSTMDGVTNGKAWVERTIAAIASAGTNAVTETVEFEVADYVDNHPTRAALGARLDRRMQCEARRLGLENPRIVAEFQCSREMTLALVRRCEGDRTIKAGGVP